MRPHRSPEKAESEEAEENDAWFVNKKMNQILAREGLFTEKFNLKYKHKDSG